MNTEAGRKIHMEVAGSRLASSTESNELLFLFIHISSSSRKLGDFCSTVFRKGRRSVSTFTTTQGSIFGDRQAGASVYSTVNKIFGSRQ